jgi:hypothetical protein
MKKFGGRFIFLDIDGVLNRGHDSTKGGFQWSAPECIAALNKITDTTGAHIVVSSAWRHSHTLNGLRKVLSEWGVTGSIVDVTPAHLMGPFDEEEGRNLMVPRTEEIDWWLRKEPGEVTDFVILDDNDPQIGVDFDHPMPHLEPHFILTDTRVGLTDELADRAIQILENPHK